MAPTEETYALTPVQHGMLLHRLEGENPGVDIEQILIAMPEALDLDAFERAWRAMARRHPILRTRFAWTGADEPRQEVVSDVEPTIDRRDLRGMDRAAQEAEIERYLAADRARGFDFAVAPMWRVAVFRLGDAEHRLAWTYSHALLDNTFADVLRELMEAYDADLRGEAPRFEARTPFRDHVAWLGQHLPQNREAARAFFRAMLAGFTTPTSLGALAKASPTASEGFVPYGEEKLRLSRATSDALRALEGRGVRPSVVTEGVWALVLAAFAAQDDVVFGVTRACRRTSIPGADSAVGLFINTLPTRVTIDPEQRVVDWLQGIRERQVAIRAHEHTALVDALAVAEVPRETALFDTIVIFNREHQGTRLQGLGGAWAKRSLEQRDQTNFGVSLMAYADAEMHFKLSYDRRRFDDASIKRVAAMMRALFEAIAKDPEAKVGSLPRMPEDEARRVLVEWNDTRAPIDGDACVHRQIAAQAARSRDRAAVAFRDRSITYAELEARADALARRLRAAGVQRGHRVGIFVERSIEMVVGLLAILKSGAAYVPLDPSYPSERVALMVEDAKAFAVVTLDRLRGALPPHAANVIAIDDARAGEGAPFTDETTGDDAAYVIFTSGSTGRPKGTILRHRNVTAFFAGMDAALGTTPGTWLALTSISFDISVLELFWTLARGFTVVVQEEVAAAAPRAEAPPAIRARKMDFSLFYFAADAQSADGKRGDAYKLLLEGAKFADTHGFAAVWTPERHFHPFGGLYPNPAVTSAAVAAVTKNVALRAGSVVLPLHNPIRCAEEWSVVDNLSNGRVGLSFASGWHAADFALMPQNFADRRKVMSEGIATIRALWRGESITATSGDGKPVTLRIFPPPVQAEPPIWITASSAPETFAMAGKTGANILTNLLVMSEADLTKNIAVYREAWKAAGRAGEGTVSLMLHTFVGGDDAEVKRLVRGPFLEYLRTSTDLINKARWELTAFAKPGQVNAPEKGARDLGELTKEEMDVIMDHAFERYFSIAGLFGTPRTCLATIDRLKAVGVDEIACLIDFGVAVDTVLASLTKLDELRALSNPAAGAVADDADYQIAAQIKRHQVTHMQCTPSLASILASDPSALPALGDLQMLLLGGEALPDALVARLRPVLRGRLMNMYGPTETTIWSTCGEVKDGSITLGKPIANTRVYVVDARLRPTPLGVPGELLIGGAGVAAGYLDRPELTAERFPRDAWSDRDGDRVYRTGDLVRWRDDGRLEFLGRIDHQVKIRGHRVELGEIESALTKHPHVRDAVVVARKDDDHEARLVAYVIERATNGDASSAGAWRAIWDETYASGGARTGEATLDTAGWTSSFTGEQIAPDVMRAWVDETVARILSLAPRRVLEIGCGTGMLLFRVAPKVERYVGIDFSKEAIAGIEAKLEAQGRTNVALRALAAVDVGQLGDERFDTIVLNSVAQYLDGADALVDVITRAFAMLSPGGMFFLGDLRSLPLLDAFHAAIELHRAPDATPVGELRDRVARRAREERELVIDPALFAALARVLPDLAGASATLKKEGDEELTRFRYDVILRKAGGGAPTFAVATTVPAPERATRESLRALLDGKPAIRVAGIPDARSADAVLVAETTARGEASLTAGEVRARASEARQRGIDPTTVLDLDPAYEITAVPSSKPGAFDLLARHRASGPAAIAAFPAAAESRPWSAYTNTPSRGATRGAVGPELRAYLHDKLPEYMIPTAFVALDAFPLTPNGKVDRKALPAPDRSRREAAGEYTAPASEIERVIAQMWEDMLSIERVGVDQNFFDLGANSLMMVQASGRLRAALGREVSLVDMFRFRTVRALAAHLGGGAAQAEGPTANAKEGEDRAQARRDAMARRRDARGAARTKEGS